jgi:hypothetical protein
MRGTCTGPAGVSPRCAAAGPQCVAGRWTLPRTGSRRPAPSPPCPAPEPLDPAPTRCHAARRERRPPLRLRERPAEEEQPAPAAEPVSAPTTVPGVVRLTCVQVWTAYWEELTPSQYLR